MPPTFQGDIRQFDDYVPEGGRRRHEEFDVALLGGRPRVNGLLEPLYAASRLGAACLGATAYPVDLAADEGQAGLLGLGRLLLTQLLPAQKFAVVAWIAV